MDDTAKQDILDAIGAFAEQVDLKFEQIDRRFDKVEAELGSMKSELGSMKSELGSLKSEIGMIKATMVTKSYLDDKLADLKGDMVSMLRKEDQKVNRLLGILAEKRLLAPSEAQDVLSFRPFP